MIKAVVIKTAGDPGITRQIVRGMESPELRRIRAELKQVRSRDALYWADRLAEARRNYERATRPRSRLYKRFWGMVGLAIALAGERRDKRNEDHA